MSKGTVQALAEQIDALRIPHRVLDEDCWYSCPLAKSDRGDESACCNEEEVARGLCTCGADAHNAKVDALLITLLRIAV